MLIMEISNQTNYHKFKESVAPINSIFNILCKGAFFFYEMPTLWHLEFHKATLEQLKVEE